NILEGLRLLIGQPAFLATVDARHEAEIGGKTGTGRPGELVDHAAVHAVDAGALGSILEPQVVNRPMRHEGTGALRAGERRRLSADKGKSSENRAATRVEHSLSPVGLAAGVI